MNIASKRSIFSILAGVIIGSLISVFLTSICWGPFISVFIAAYLANVATPKEGAMIGAIVFVPIGMIFFALQAPATANDIVGKLGNFLVLFLGILIVSGIGALYGSILGKLFELTKKNGLIF